SAGHGFRRNPGKGGDAAFVSHAPIVAPSGAAGQDGARHLLVCLPPRKGLLGTPPAHSARSATADGVRAALRPGIAAARLASRIVPSATSASTAAGTAGAGTA